MKSFLSDRARITSPVLIHQSPAGSASFSAGFRGSKTDPRGAAGVGAGTANASQVECVREGDKITRLIVTCGCGERIEIDCLYTGV